MPEPITLKEIDDLAIRLTDYRSSDKVQSLEDTELINDAILVVQAYRELKKFGIVNLEEKSE